MFKKSTLLTSSLLLLLSAGIPSIAIAKKPSADAKPAISQPAQPRLTPKPTDTQLTPAPKPILQKATFEAITPGAEPRQVLRYKPVANTKEVATMTLDMDMKMVFSGTTIPTKLPSTVMKMETTVTKVDANGDIHYQFRYLDADVKGNASLPGSAINAMRSQMKKLVGLNGTFVVSDRGQLKSSNFQIPKTVDETTRGMLEQMSQSLEQFSSALPSDAVGKGAKWRIVQPLQISGINMVQTSTYELVGVQDGVMTLKTTVAQSANPQVLKQSGLPANVTMQLNSMSSTGQGETVVRLDRLLPTKAALSISSQSEMEVKSTRQGTPMTVSTDSKIESTFEAQANK
jgi:hypothetical protein